MDGNLLTATTELAMHVTLPYIQKGDFVIDATCGNGRDTAVLARAAGDTGIVLAVDIQPQAIENTRCFLQQQGIGQAVLRQGSFVHLSQYAEEICREKKPAAILFNLGYLPGGDKKITTRVEDTLKAVESAVNLIKNDGIVTAVLYPGHEEGNREKDALTAWASDLDGRMYHTVYASLPNQKKNPPEILWITRKR